MKTGNAMYTNIGGSYLPLLGGQQPNLDGKLNIFAETKDNTNKLWHERQLCKYMYTSDRDIFLCAIQEVTDLFELEESLLR